MNEKAHKLAIKMLADALEIDAASAATASLGETRGWDSIGHMRLILAIEELTGTTLEPEAIVSLATVDDVARVLEAGL